MSYSVTFYENDEMIDLNQINDTEFRSLNDYLLKFAEGDKINFPHIIDEEKQNYVVIVESNVEKIEKMIDKKIVINPEKYGKSSWGNVEMYLEKFDLKKNKKESDKKIRKCSKCNCEGHNIRKCPLLNESTVDEEKQTSKKSSNK